MLGFERVKHEDACRCLICDPYGCGEREGAKVERGRCLAILDQHIDDLRAKLERAEKQHRPLIAARCRKEIGRLSGIRYEISAVILEGAEE